MPSKQRAAHTPRGYAWETFTRAKQAFNLGLYTASICIFQQALDQFNQLLDDEGAAMCKGAIAAALNNTGDPKLAVSYAIDSLDFYQRQDLKPQLAEQRQNIAIMFTSLGLAQEAEKYYVLASGDYESLEQFEQAGKNKHTAANLYARRKQPAEARQYFVEAIDLFQRAATSTAQQLQATALMQLAYLENLVKNPDASRLLYVEALEIFEELYCYWELATCLEGLAAVEFDVDEPEHAAVHARRALEVFTAHGYDDDASRAAANYRATLRACRVKQQRDEELF
ncbi:MAG: hypothetical protein Q4C74_00545 [Rothia sp. (in: high G+C Gram-positive bacteria)]|nr:hypothetical protein [Rothia sp. (in: high G+C Gram-positive bacteria)]